MAKKRAASPAKKAMMAACWQRARDRHASRSAAQGRAEAGNRRLRAAGKPTLWDTACALRSGRRHPKAVSAGAS